MNEQTAANEEIKTEETAGENESMTDGAEMREQEDIPVLKDKVVQLETENAELKRRLFCMSKGIPENIAGDIICIAQRRCETEDCDFETAVREAYERIAGFAEHYGNAARSSAVTTGVRSQNTAASDDPLRRAFGLL